MIALVAKSEPVPAEDVFTLGSIAVSAVQVMNRCVLGGPHFGGKVAIGPRDIFEVGVIESGQHMSELGLQSA